MTNLRTKLKSFKDNVIGKIPNPEKWVFIVGCYNSGTTLLHDILIKNQKIGYLPSEG